MWWSWLSGRREGAIIIRPVTVLEYYTPDEPKFATRYKKRERCKGKFHGFGIDYEEFESGPGNFSTAIVELEDGEVINIPVELIRFDDTDLTESKKIPGWMWNV